ncbi:M20 family metallopeptidase [Chelatococcus sp. SYSU_G07232]|uniref:M20 family metallopeptidase n=1 Tax=Chelatococcus albus TaxID=3047466 RepID=A0ABT7AIP3_9HYPH|nr:M20 family metallopeptidase [Chelatococcus sp. SYSU_G07232]MDJ1158664.1 M20 family metallopeptidase [Chelatococcus sp. SYSU_G07232]
MIDLLGEVVNIDGGSYDKAGVDAVGERFRRFFADHGIAVSVTPDATFGNALHAVVDGPNAGGGAALLMGHRDTVFPKGEPLRRPFRFADGRAYGPGVADMKGGLVMNAFVLAAFKRFGGAPLPVTVLMTGDEEIGSPFSRPVIESEARKARVVFNAEPGRPSGNVVSGRKGGLFLKLDVYGKAAHSGANFADGINAIGELAHKTVALHGLTDVAAGITVNVGLVRGGQSVNTTAPHAEAEIDIRYVTPEQRRAVMEAVTRIVETSIVPGTRAALETKGEFLPLVATPEARRLLVLYREAAADAGLTLDGEFTGGCADSGFAASVGTPTICGLGPVGGKAHTPDEYLELDSLVPRAQALALAILRLDSAL